MYKCKNCGTEFDSKFCPECGIKREDARLCPECGSPLNPEARFCHNCGAALSRDGVSEEAAKGAPAIEREQIPETRPKPTAEKNNKELCADGRLSILHTALKYLPAMNPKSWTEK